MNTMQLIHHALGDDERVAGYLVDAALAGTLRPVELYYAVICANDKARMQDWVRENIPQDWVDVTEAPRN